MPFVPGRSRIQATPSRQSGTSFVEEDADGPGLLAALTTRPDLPPPSYVLHSSPGRVHVLLAGRDDFERGDVEALQKRLARELARIRPRRRARRRRGFLAS